MTMHPVFFQKDVILARENLMELALLISSAAECGF